VSRILVWPAILAILYYSTYWLNRIIRHLKKDEDDWNSEIDSRMRAIFSDARRIKSITDTLECREVAPVITIE
jgi:hypothetical protein